MIFYLGDKVDNVTDNKVRLAKNKAKSWEYGYDESIDTVIISKEGTLGEIYRISGINIGFPEVPAKDNILNHDKTAANQKFKREEMPAGLTEATMHNSKYVDYIDREYERREKGVWAYIKGIPVYITGTYYYGIQWIESSLISRKVRFLILAGPWFLDRALAQR